MYTKSQLLNYLLTGNVSNGSGQITDAAGFAGRTIDYAIAHNPTAVYAWLKKTYGKDYPNLLPGTEYNVAAQDGMSRFMRNKTAGMTNDQQLAYGRMLLSLPANNNINNWTTPTN